MVLTTLFFSWYIRQQQWHLPEETAVIAASAPAASGNDFDAFYHQFHSDSTFQIEHIIFPLQGIPARDSSFVSSNETFHWQKDQWVLHRAFDDMGGSFKREFLNMGADLMIENIKHVNGRYGMQRRFAKYDDGWHLIYYAAMNELASAEPTNAQ